MNFAESSNNINLPIDFYHGDRFDAEDMIVHKCVRKHK